MERPKVTTKEVLRVFSRSFRGAVPPARMTVWRVRMEQGDVAKHVARPRLLSHRGAVGSQEVGQLTRSSQLW